MSNPIVARTSEVRNRFEELMLSADFDNEYADGVFRAENLGGVEGVLSLAKERGRRDAVLEMLKRKSCILLRPSLRLAPVVAAGLVFNEGATKRPLAITGDSELQFRKRSLLSTMMRNVFLQILEREKVRYDDVWGDALEERTRMNGIYDFDTIYQRTLSYFMVSGGTQNCMGRLEKALPEPAVTRLTPITIDEANRAYEACGFYHGSKWQGVFPHWIEAFGEPWPLGTGDGRVVTINKDASLGIPYYAKASDTRALHACLEVMAEMQRGLWKTDAAKAYKLAMVNRPALVTFLGKTKTDIYKAEKIEKQQLRFYLVAPGHLKLTLQRVCQPFSEARVSHHDLVTEFERNPFNEEDEFLCRLRSLRSVQKMGLTGSGADLMIRALDSQLEKNGYAYLHCGDDTIFAMWIWRVVKEDDGSSRTKPMLVVFGVDQSNFDLTQRADVFAAVDDRLRDGLAHIDANIAGLWREIRRGRLTNIHQAGIVYVEGTGTSGINLQSEVNGMGEEVYCDRLIRRLTLKARVMDSGTPAYHVSPEDLRSAVLNVGLGMGLDARLEFIRNCSNSTVLTGRKHMIRKAICSGELNFTFLGFVFQGDVIANPNEYPSNGRVGLGLYQDEHDVQLNGFLPRAVAHPIAVVPDMGRMLTNLLYANLPWVKGDVEFRIYDVLRLFGTMIQTGMFFIGEHHFWASCEGFGLVKDLMLMELDGIDGSRQIVHRVEDGAFTETAVSPKSVKELRRMILELRETIYRVWNPYTLDRPRKNLTLPARNVREVFPAQPVSVGLNWADTMEEEETREINDMLFSGTDDDTLANMLATVHPRSFGGEELFPLRTIILRQVTERNWALPPPSVVVRHPQTLNPVPQAAGDRREGGGSKKTQKRKAQKRRAREGARNAQTETEEHFASQREEEALRREEEAAADAELRALRLEELQEERQRRLEERY